MRVAPAVDWTLYIDCTVGICAAGVGVIDWTLIS